MEALAIDRCESFIEVLKTQRRCVHVLVQLCGTPNVIHGGYKMYAWLFLNGSPVEELDTY